MRQYFLTDVLNCLIWSLGRRQSVEDAFVAGGSCPGKLLYPQHDGLAEQFNPREERCIAASAGVLQSELKSKYEDFSSVISYGICYQDAQELLVPLLAEQHRVYLEKCLRVQSSPVMCMTTIVKSWYVMLRR